MKITEALSIYAAILSTIVFAWNIRKTIPSYKVEILIGTDKVDDEYISGLYISVNNPSAHTVHLSNISVLYPHGERNLSEKLKHIFRYRRLPFNVGWCSSSLSNYEIDDKCPIALESGKSIGILVPETVLESIFENCDERLLKASAQDELWRNRYSNEIEYPKIVTENK